MTHPNDTPPPPVSEYPTDGHFCRRCESYRTKAANSLCVVCLDDDARRESEQCHS